LGGLERRFRVQILVVSRRREAGNSRLFPLEFGSTKMGTTRI